MSECNHNYQFVVKSCIFCGEIYHPKELLDSISRQIKDLTKNKGHIANGGKVVEPTTEECLEVEAELWTACNTIGCKNKCKLSELYCDKCLKFRLKEWGAEFEKPGIKKGGISILGASQLKPVDQNCLYKSVNYKLKGKDFTFRAILIEWDEFQDNLPFWHPELRTCSYYHRNDIEMSRIPDYDYGDGGNYE